MKKIIFILALMVAVCFSKSMSAQTANQLRTQRDSIHALFMYTLNQYDSLVTRNNEIEKRLEKQRLELADLKKQVESVLKNKDESAKELNKAKELIEELVLTIDKLEAEVKRLTPPKKKE